MKKFICGLIIGLLLATSISTLASGQALRLIVNGEDITAEAQPVIIDGRTLVPARALAEKLGAKVEWVEANQTVVVTSFSKITTEAEVADGLISLNGLIEAHGVYVEVGDNVLLKKGSIEIVFPRPSANSQTITVETNVGPLTVKVDSGRFYFIKKELQAKGII